MKINKLAALGAIAAVSALYIGAAPSTSALGDLTTKDALKFYDESGAMSYTVGSYSDECGITNVTLHITVTDDAVNKILGQKSGAGSSLSTFYTGVEPVDLQTHTVQKNGTWVLKTADKTCADLKTAVNTAIKNDTSAPNTNTPFWTNTLRIQYKDPKSGEWTTSDSTGSASQDKSIKQDLMVKLGISDEKDLVYGVNYRFFAFADWDYVTGWQDQSNANDMTYIRINYDVDFPVSTIFQKGQKTYYPSIESAIAGGATAIDVSEDVTVPAGSTLTVSKGVKLTVAEGKKIVNNGTIVLENGAVIVGEDITNTGEIVVNAGATVSAPVANSGKVAIEKGATVEGKLTNNSVVVLDRTDSTNAEKFGTTVYSDLSGNKVAYYASLPLALADKTNNNVVIAGNTSAKAFEIPAGKTLAIASDVKLTLDGGGKITAGEGTALLASTGSVVDDKGNSLLNNLSYETTVAGEVQSGSMSSSGTTAWAGDKIEVPTVANKTGYNAGLTVWNDSTKETIEVKDGKFTMPAADVTITTEYTVKPIKFKYGEDSYFNGGNALDFVTDGALDMLSAVTVDGKVLTNNVDYRMAENSDHTTYILLLVDFLSTLETGKHTLALTYSTGAVGKATFYVDTRGAAVADASTGVVLADPNNKIPEGAKLEVEYVSITEEKVNEVVSKDENLLMVLDFTLKDSTGNVLSQFGEGIEVRIPIYMGLDGYDPENFYARYVGDVAESDIKVKIVEYENESYFSFIAKHFSTYAIVNTDNPRVVDYPATGAESVTSETQGVAQTSAGILAAIAAAVTSVVTFVKLHKKSEEDEDIA